MKRTAEEVRATLHAKLLVAVEKHPNDPKIAAALAKVAKGDKMPPELLEKFKGESDKKDDDKGDKKAAGEEWIIMKSSRARADLDVTPSNAYGQKSTCEKAGVKPSQVYTDKKKAEADAKKLAKVNPVGFKVVLLKGKGDKKASQDKIAIKQETMDFIRWALSTQAPMSPSEIEAFTNRQLNIKTSPPVKKRTGPRFQSGDQVEIIAAKHKDRGSDIGPYKLFNGKIGTVVSTEGDDVMVVIKGEPAPIRFGNGLKTRGVGIYKYTPAYDINGSAKIEMIYLADPSSKSGTDQKAEVEVYLGRSRGTEKRSASYYTGHVVFAALNKSGQFYFRGFPQQRMRVDPKADAGFRPRTFNPSKGKVLYIGPFGKRPSNWKPELEKIEKDMENG